MVRPVFLEVRLLTQCFTFRRGFNLLKITASIVLSKLTKHPIVWGYPYAASIEPTSHCNLHCAECPSGNGSLNRPHGYITFDLYKQIIDEIYPYTFYINLYFQGEPMMHPQFPEMVAYAKSKRMFVFTSTNGHFLKSETAKMVVLANLDKMIISLDGATQNDYQQYRIGGKLSTVIEGMKTIATEKKSANSKTPIVVAQILLLKTTELSIRNIKEIARSAGANYTEIKKAQFYQPNSKDALIPSNPKFIRYTYQPETGWTLKNKHHKGCNRLWNTTVINWEGDVLPCCYDKDANHKWGSVLHQNLFSVFHSKEATKFRKNVLATRSKIDICSNCGE